MISCANLRELMANEKLYHSLFSDRTEIFGEKLQWNCNRNADGYEVDSCDDESSRYVVLHSPNGSHWGSMRLRPLDRESMTARYFPEFYGCIKMDVTDLVEASRFMIKSGLPISRRLAVSILFQGVYEVVKESHSQGIAGVFSHKMKTVYQAHGWSPREITSFINEGEQLEFGIWHLSSWQFRAVRTLKRFDEPHKNWQPPRKRSVNGVVAQIGA